MDCGKPGHYARECRSASKQNGPQQNGQRNNNGNKNKQYAHKVSAIAEDNDAIVDEDTEKEAVGYTSNNINSVPSCGVNKSPFYDPRKLAGVPGQINNYHNPRILIDNGSPVTMIRSDLWKQIKDPNTIVNEEEVFSGSDTRWTKDCGGHSTETALRKITHEAPSAHHRQDRTQIHSRKRLSDSTSATYSTLPRLSCSVVNKYRIHSSGPL